MEALSAIAKIGKDNIKEEIAKNIVSLVVKECKKSDMQYRRKALACLHSLLQTFTMFDHFSQVKETVLENILQNDTSTSKQAAEGEPNSKPLELLIRLLKDHTYHLFIPELLPFNVLAAPGLKISKLNSEKHRNY